MERAVLQTRQPGRSFLGCRKTIQNYFSGGLGSCFLLLPRSSFLLIVAVLPISPLAVADEEASLPVAVEELVELVLVHVVELALVAAAQADLAGALLLAEHLVLHLVAAQAELAVLVALDPAVLVQLAVLDRSRLVFSAADISVYFFYKYELPKISVLTELLE